MRPRRALSALCVVLALSPASPAAAEWHIVPLVGLTFHANTNASGLEPVPIPKHVNIGGAVTLLGNGIFGVEGVTVFTTGFRGVDPAAAIPSTIQSSRVFGLAGNAVLTTPKHLTEYSLRPYVSGGIGFMRLDFVVQGSEALSLHENFPALNIGGGAVGFFTQHTGVRFDFRYYKRIGQTTPGSAVLVHPEVSFMTLSVGVVIRR
jgi:outer membrane protein with beta-barrel domain